MPFCLYAGCYLWTKQKQSGSALCLYAGCHSVYMPDVTFVFTNAVKVYCVYMPDASLSICRMSCVFEQDRESAMCLYAGCHSVYMPDVTLVNKSWKCIVSICRMSFCLYSGCLCCINKIRGSVLSDAILSICRMSLWLNKTQWKCIVFICWRAQESSGEFRRTQENLGELSRAHESPGELRRAQEIPGDSRRCQKSLGEFRRTQESPGAPRRPRESHVLCWSGEPRRAMQFCLYAGCYFD